MIEAIKLEGFGVMRLPVHWFNMMEDDYTINSKFTKKDIIRHCYTTRTIIKLINDLKLNDNTRYVKYNEYIEAYKQIINKYESNLKKHKLDDLIYLINGMDLNENDECERMGLIKDELVQENVKNIYTTEDNLNIKTDNKNFINNDKLEENNKDILVEDDKNLNELFKFLNANSNEIENKEESLLEDLMIIIFH